MLLFLLLGLAMEGCGGGAGTGVRLTGGDWLRQPVLVGWPGTIAGMLDMLRDDFVTAS